MRFIHACPSLSSSTLHLFHSGVIYSSDGLSNRFSSFSLPLYHFHSSSPFSPHHVPPQSSLVCLDGRCRNPQKGRVKIAIINATIINEETDETYNPYVRLFVKGDLVHTSKPKRNTNTPSWKFALAIDNFMIDEPIQFKLMTRNPTGDIELFSHRVTVSQFKSTQSPVTTISSGSTCKYFPDSNFSRLCFGVEWTPKTIV